MSQDPTRWLKRFVWAVIIAIIVGCSGELSAEESGDILWFSKPRGGDTLLVQLHRGGYAWVHFDARTRRKAMSQAALTIAFRTDPRVYDELRQRFRAAGLTAGLTAECSPGFRVGIYPVPRLSAPGVVCAGTSGLIDELEQALLPALDTLLSSWERMIEISHAAISGAVLEEAELEVTLTSVPGRGLVESAGKRTALISEQLVQTLRGPWGVEPALVHYAASVRLGKTARINLTFPKNTPLFVNGTDAAKSSLFTLVDSTDEQFVTAWRNLPWRWYRFHRGSGNVANAWVYFPSSLWFPAQLWEDSPDIAIDYKRGAEFVTRARFEPARGKLQLCAPDGTCSSLDAADARGLAAQAYAECVAALTKRQPWSSDRNVDPVSLLVRIAEHTCDLSFDRYCLSRQQPGLDRVIQMLAARSVEPNQLGDRRPRYPLCTGSSL